MHLAIKQSSLQGGGRGSGLNASLLIDENVHLDLIHQEAFLFEKVWILKKMYLEY